MKKFWKVLGFAALVAAALPYKVEENLETGEKTYDALLWQMKLRRNEDDSVEKQISILPCRRPAKARQEESDMFEDENWMYSPTSAEIVEDPSGELPF